MKWLSALFILLLQPSAVVYVAPYGIANADGSPENPRSLASVVCAGCGGGTVWLMPGTYAGPLRIDANDTVYRSVPGTRARIDGKLEVYGVGNTLQDLELTYTGWVSRTSAYAGGTPTDQPWNVSLDIYGARTRFIHNYVHDLAGIGFWKTATNSEFAYNVVHNNGWMGTDRGHGPALYAQNNADGTKDIHDNVILPTYSMTGFQFYGSSIAPLDHFYLSRNVVVNTRFLLGGGAPVKDARINGNLLWKTSLEAGYIFATNEDAQIGGNYIGLGELAPWRFKRLTMTGNTAINAGGLAVMELKPPTQTYTYTIAANSYAANAAVVFWHGSSVMPFAGWQATGNDAGGSFTGLPTTPAIFVQPTTPHHGIVTVYNWGGAASVNVDVASLALTPGASYKLVNALNPMESLSFAATPTVSLPMNTGWSVATPYAAATPLINWSSQFAVFLVEPQ